MNKTPTRIRYKLENNVLKSNSFVTNEGSVATVEIDPSSNSLRILVRKNEVSNVNSFTYKTVREAKAQAKVLLGKVGVIFYEEIRLGRKKKAKDLQGFTRLPQQEEQL